MKRWKSWDVFWCGLVAALMAVLLLFGILF